MKFQDNYNMQIKNMEDLILISYVMIHQFPSFQKVKVLINRKNQTRIHFLRIYGSSRKRPKIIHAK